MPLTGSSDRHARSMAQALARTPASTARGATQTAGPRDGTDTALTTAM
jgi:hypothetical protein